MEFIDIAYKRKCALELWARIQVLWKGACLLALPIGKRFWHCCHIWAQNFGWNLTECGRTCEWHVYYYVHAYDGWACSLQPSSWIRQEVLDQVRKVFGLKFEPAVKGRGIESLGNELLVWVNPLFLITKHPSINQHLHWYHGRKNPNLIWIADKHYRYPNPRLNQGLWGQN
jgi:hypothetical protein